MKPLADDPWDPQQYYTFRHSLLPGVDDAVFEACLPVMEDLLRGESYLGGAWQADYHRLRFIAVKPLTPDPSPLRGEGKFNSNRIAPL
jgi:hypothetical protein